jgi:hypothetical protein
LHSSSSIIRIIKCKKTDVDRKYNANGGDEEGLYVTGRRARGKETLDGWITLLWILWR